MPPNALSLKIAGIVIDVRSDVEFRRFNDYGFYKDFIIGPPEEADCRLEHSIGQPPDMEFDGGHFNANGVWRLSRSGEENALWVGPPPKRGKPDNAVVFNSDYSRGSMYQKSVYELFRRFIDQFLVINLLSRKGGFLLHSSGVVWDGLGICFIGPSGAGKSTLLDLFKGEVDRKSLLNDDRLALRKRGNKWQVFGTPWYGESRVSSSRDAPLTALFFIRHSPDNYIRPLTAIEALHKLMVEALVPVWDGQATGRVLGTFQDLIGSVPAYEFGFVPDRSAVEFVKNVIKR